MIHPSITREYLNMEFQTKLIGCPAWPLVLANINSFLWDHVKQFFYIKPLTIRKDMKQRIRYAFQSSDENSLINVNKSCEFIIMRSWWLYIKHFFLVFLSYFVLIGFVFYFHIPITKPLPRLLAEHSCYKVKSTQSQKTDFSCQFKLKSTL